MVSSSDMRMINSNSCNNPITHMRTHMCGANSTILYNSNSHSNTRAVLPKSFANLL